MASLPLSLLPIEALHLDAFQGLEYSLERAYGSNEFILTAIRRCGEHEVEEKLKICITPRRNGGDYVSAACAGTQCCPNAPQGDIRHLLFNNGHWIADDERVLISHLDEPCSGGQETGTSSDSDSVLVSGSVLCSGVQETGTLAESASSHSVASEIDDYSAEILRPVQIPSPQRLSEGSSLLIAKILSGLTKILLNKSDYSSNAITTAWKGNHEISSLLDFWDKAAVNGSGVTSAIMATEKRTMKSRGEAEYLHWLGKIMIGFLVLAQTKREPLSKTQFKENRFIKWARRLPRLLRLLQVTGMAGLLILTAIGNSFYNFSELMRMSESNLDIFLKTEWANLRPKLSYLYHRVRGTHAFDQEVSIFNPVAFCCRYLRLQRRESVDYREMCELLGAGDWVKAKSDVFERKTIGELLAAQEDSELDLSLRSVSGKDSKEWKDLVAALDRLHVDAEPQPTSAAERQTPPSRQGTTSYGPSYDTGLILNTPDDDTSPRTASGYRRDDGSILEEPTGPYSFNATRSGFAVNQSFGSDSSFQCSSWVWGAELAPSPDTDDIHMMSSISETATTGYDQVLLTDDAFTDNATDGNACTAILPLSLGGSSPPTNLMSISYLLRRGDAESSDAQVTLLGRESPTASATYHPTVGSAFHLTSGHQQSPPVQTNQVIAPDLNALPQPGNFDMDNMPGWAGVMDMSMNESIERLMSDWNTVRDFSHEQVAQWNRDFALPYEL